MQIESFQMLKLHVIEHFVEIHKIFKNLKLFLSKGSKYYSKNHFKNGKYIGYVPLLCDAERNRSADIDRNSVRKFRKPLLTFSNLLFLFSDFDSGIGSEGARDAASE